MRYLRAKLRRVDCVGLTTLTPEIATAGAKSAASYSASRERILFWISEQMAGFEQ